MNVVGQKRDLEKKRRRMRSLGRDLDIVDKVRLQRLEERRERKKDVVTEDIYDQEEKR